ncbi:hypothetical protein [Treponema bryantii]|uniref:hypothetical protein n=1 Tax=Treponema bryantii TaxID=163 RepID=UPI0003B56CE4|nr:hypothetical protein [Treponema bryantii]
METIKKLSVMLMGLSLAVTLFFSCSNSSSPEETSTTTTEETTVTSDSDTTNNTSEEASTNSGTNGITVSSTYTEPRLPDNVGEDPFNGKTYKLSSTSRSGYAFESHADGTPGVLTYTHGDPGNDKKYQYTYNETTKELSLKLTHMSSRNENREWSWFTYSEMIEKYRNTYFNFSYTNYVTWANEQGKEIMTETQFNQFIQYDLDQLKAAFEKLYVYKAEDVIDENDTHKLKIRTKYYKTNTVPSQLPDIETVTFSSSPYSLKIRTYVNVGGGDISYFKNNDTIYIISNVTANKIFAKEATPIVDNPSNVESDWEYVENAPQLQMNYSLSLGNDNNLIILLSGSDVETNRFFSEELMARSITLTTSTAFDEYTLQQ